MSTIMAAKVTSLHCNITVRSRLLRRALRRHCRKNWIQHQFYLRLRPLCLSPRKTGLRLAHATAARTVCATAGTIPIIADADTGAGNALNVQRTAKDLIATVWLAAFLRIKHGQRNVVIPTEEHAAKIASARDAIGDSVFFLVARTDVRAMTAKPGLSDAIARANLHME